MRVARLADARPRTAPQALFEVAALHPEHVRFIDRGAPIRLADLAGRVRQYASFLRSRGIRPGDHVALFGPNSLDWIVAALAVQTCGAAFVGVHAGSSAELASFIVEHSDAKLVIAAPSELERTGLKAFAAPLWRLGEPVPQVGYGLADASALDQTACLIYTSGTTGRPKGVVLTHRNLAANGLDWADVCGPLVPEEPREVLWLPFSHIFGWGDACIGTAMGFTSMLAAPMEVPQALAAYRPHVLMTVPMLLERLAPEALGGEIRLCLAGGAALSPAVKRRYRDAGVLVLEGYGLTETSPTLTLTRPQDEALDTVGRPYPSVKIRIADDGEVLASGPSVFSGYYRNPEATAEAIRDGWFHTGDLGQLTERGELRIVGRKKEMLVLSSGKKVAPAAIEAAAQQDPWIQRLVLFGDGRPVVVALVVPDVAAMARDLGRPIGSPEEAHAELAPRIERLNRSLSTFERIRAFAVAPRPLTVEAGHLTPSFKIRRHAVWKDFRSVVEELYQPAEARP